MNVHEYQAKSLLKTHRIPVPLGAVAATPEAAAETFRSLGVARAAVKAQIHAGGRGKAGGIKLVTNEKEAAAAAAAILGRPLVTHQTGPAGRIVRHVLVEEGLEVQKELYLGIVLDRKANRPMLMASSEGGMDIEEVAAKWPEKIHREEIHAGLGLQEYQGRKLCALLGLPQEHHRTATAIFVSLARMYLDLDCTLAEINPLGIVKGRGVMALDGKLNFDDRALYRHADLQALHDPAEEDPNELEAAKYGLSYVSMDGDIGCMVNGAGLAMSTMDMIQHHGGTPANFLDVGGGASKDQVTQAFKLLLANPKVRAVLVNIFGGIMKCDVIAQGVIAAAREVALEIPLVVRLEGTNVEAGRKLLAESGLNLSSATDMSDAARKIVAAAKGAA